MNFIAILLAATLSSGNAEFDAAYDGTGSFTSPAFIWAGEKIQEWVKKGYFNDGFNSMILPASQQPNGVKSCTTHN